jgi:acyl transferase domain-containing protein/acyl carrier protein
MTQQKHRRSSRKNSAVPITPVAQFSPGLGEPIAIVGLSCRFPGAPDQQAYWDLLREGRDAIREVPSNRHWDKSHYYSSDPDVAGKMYTWEGGFLDEFEKFDASFFGISPREAAQMDPQQRLLLETVWEALEDGGQAPARLEGTSSGVFVGISTNDFLQIGCRFGDPLKIDQHSGTGSADSLASGRISFCLGLQGPNFPVDTACSSSLVALHLACQSLRNQECRVAVVAAVNLMLSPETSVYFCKVKALAPDGRCKAFDASANGYGRSEGAGAVVVKRLCNAIADGDRILAIIRGSAINHDGRTTGLTVPNGDSQERLIRQALVNAGVTASQVGYVEAHGTGTPLGDPIEFRALKNTYCAARDRHRPLLVGSAKTNIGHTEAAAGMAGLIKLVLSLQHRKIPAHLHFQHPNPYIAWGNTPLEVVTSLRDWEPIEGRRLAGLSSFGFSGTNAHVILEEAPHEETVDVPTEAPKNSLEDSDGTLLTVSGKSLPALRENLSRLKSFLQRSESPIDSVAYSLAHGRSHFPHRWSCIAKSTKDVLESIDQYLHGATTESQAKGKTRTSKAHAKIAWIFGGQGAHALGMGRQLFDTFEVFRNEWERCDAIVAAETGLSIIGRIYDSKGVDFDSSCLIHSSLFAFEYSLARLWQSWGVNPTMVLGHSLGEFVAGVFAGIFSLEDSLRFVARRAKIVDEIVQPGRMLSVAADAQSIQSLVGQRKWLVQVGAINAPRITVVAGSCEAIEEFSQLLQESRIPFTDVPSLHAFHSPAMDEVIPKIEGLASEMTLHTPRIGFVPASTGELDASEVHSTDYWVQQIRLPVQFMKSIQTLSARDYNVFLEINAAPVLTRCARQCLPKTTNSYIATLQGGESSLHDLQLAACELYRHQVDLDWKSFWAYKKPKLISVPTYAFQRESLAPSFDATQLQRRSAPFASSASLRKEDRPEDHAEKVVVEHESPADKILDAADCVYRLEWQELSLLSSSGDFQKSMGASVPSCQETVEGRWLVVASAESDRVRQFAEDLATHDFDCEVLILPKTATTSDDRHCSVIDEIALDSMLLQLGDSGKAWKGILFVADQPQLTADLVTSDAILAFQEKSLGGIQGWVRSYQRRPLPNEPRWIVLTSGVFDDDTGMGPVASDVGWWNAALWGMGRVLQLEQPQWRCQFVDIDSLTGNGAVAEADGAHSHVPSFDRLLTILRQIIPEDQVAIRNGRTWVRRLIRDLERPASEIPSQLRHDQTYLITGGLGGLGGLLVTQLIRSGAKSICLVGRGSLTQEVEAKLQRWGEEGLDVFYLRCDISEEVQVEELFRTLDREGKSVDGVFHLAGTLDDDYLSNLDWPRFERVLSSKICGAWNLHRVTRDRPLQYFVCFSSIAAVFGGLKQGNYAAANAWIDRLMRYRKSASLPGLSINWGPWEEAGMAARMGHRQFQGWASVGVQVLPTSVGFQNWIPRLHSEESQIAFVPVNWSRALQFFPPGLEPPLFRRMAIAERQQLKPSSYWQSLASDLAKLPASEHWDLVLDYVEAHVSDVLGIPKSKKLDAEAGFVEQGMDSLMAIDLRSRLQVDLGLQHVLPVSFVIDYPTLSRMTQYYLANVFPRLRFSDAPLVKSGDVNEPIVTKSALDTIEAWQPLPIAEWTQNTDRVDDAVETENPIARAPARAKRELASKSIGSEPIAIIGMSCRFPGGISSPEKYWQALIEGRDAVVEVPRIRWDVDAWYDPNPDAVGKINCRYGGFLQDVETFDASFFGIAPREAVRMDPQQRMLLEMTVETLEDALIPVESLTSSNTSVAIGISGNDYLSVLRRANDMSMIDGWLAMGNALSIAAGRISHVFGWHGPCTILDTACSSSLAAIYTACMNLRNRQTDLALAGGSNLILGPEISISLTKAHALSRDGRCKAFDANANGYVRGEGLGMIALKRLDDAVRDGNEILAVIHGMAMNHDGHSSGLTVPSVVAQESLIRSALNDAQRSPVDIDYVEAHGTGTPLGDPIEMQAIGRVFGSGGRRLRELCVGSVKANLGHLEAAAGIAGLMKVVLALKHQLIPPQLHFRQPSPVIPWHELPVRIPVKAEEWKASERSRFAGVSSFGFSGTNLHLVLGEGSGERSGTRSEKSMRGDGYSIRINGENKPDTSVAQLLCISAKTDVALRELARRYFDLFETSPDIDFGDVCYTANTGRTHYGCRLTIVASTTKQAAENISLWLQGKASANAQHKTLEAGRTPKIACLFTGQGSQYATMGHHLMKTQPLFRRSMIACDTYLRERFDLPLLEILYGNVAADDPQRIDRTSIAQPALFSLEASLVDLWKSWGVRPNAVMGHSLGEFSAAYAAGVFSLEDGLMLTAERGRLMDSVQVPGAMAVLFAPKQFVESAIELNRLPISIAAINGPLNTVISGAKSAVELMLKEVEKAGVQYKSLAVSQAFHSELMESIQPAFLEIARRIDFRMPSLGIISNVTGDFASAEITTPEYWCAHIRKPVLFADGLKSLHQRNYRAFLEVGPDATLIGMGRHIFNDESSNWITGLRKQSDGHQQMLRALGALTLCGVAVDWNAYYRDSNFQKVAIPKYAFQRKRYWPLEPDAKDEVALAWLGSGESKAEKSNSQSLRSSVLKATNETALIPIGDPLVGRRFESSIFRGTIFENEFSFEFPAFLKEHKVHTMVVVPGATYLSMAIAALGHDCDLPVQLSEVSFPEPLFLNEKEQRQVQVVLSHDDRHQEQFRIYSKSIDESSAQWRLHAGGMIHATRRTCGSGVSIPRQVQNGVSSAANSVDVLDLESIQSRCSEHIPDTRMFYDIMARTGVELGASFRWNSEVWRCGGESLSHMLAPVDLSDAYAKYYHPGLVDSCIQSAALSMPKSAHDFNAYIPVQVQRFVGYLPTTGELWCHCRVTEDARRTNGSLLFDVKLYNTSGQKVFEMLGLRLQRAPRTAIAAFAQRKLRDWMYRLDWVPAALEPMADPSVDGKWILFSDSLGIGGKIAKSLVGRGGECVEVKIHSSFEQFDAKTFGINPDSKEDFQRLLQSIVRDASEPIRGIVFLWPVKRNIASITRITHNRFEAAQRTGVQSLLYLLQAIGSVQLRTPPHLWAVTRKTQSVGRTDEAVDIDQASLWGFCRVASLEFPHMRMVRIDLDTDSSTAFDAKTLAAEIATPTEEDQIAYRAGERFVARLMKGIKTESRLDRIAGPDGTEPYRLIKSDTNSIEELSFQLMNRINPSIGEVEIGIRATGLNFRDVLNALGLYPGEAGPLGFECAGTVTGAGPDIKNVAVGDRVLAIAPGALGPYVLTDARLVVPIPEGMTFEEAATIPIVFLTVEIALCQMAKLRAGDTVLIHSAAGGVGLAAIQAANAIGARVIATAGSECKRDYLRQLGVQHVFDSRNADFVIQVRDATEGRGVDVVLNALPGEFVGLSVASLANNGRFVEIGKSKTWDEERWGQRRPDIQYMRFALDELAVHQPTTLGDEFRKLMNKLEQGIYRPLPRIDFEMQDVKDAFRYMAQAKHIGKVIIRQEEFQHQQLSSTRVKEDGSYLITGGLGGIGLLTARWLADRGAKHIVLAGRRPPNDEAKRMIEELNQIDVQVYLMSVDLSSQIQVTNMMREISKKCPPLRGIVHGAGILDDGIVLQQDWSRFEKVMHPKTHGMIHLHNATKDLPLDWLIIYSSIASLWGSPGQSNYAAANAMLDAFASARRQSGMPALGINWGPWAEIGMAAKMENAGRHWWEVVGIGMIPPSQGIAILELLLQEDASQTAILPIDWQRLIAQVPQGVAPPLIRELVRNQTRKLEPSKEWLAFVAKLTAAPPTERIDMLVQHTCEEAARILGLDGAADVNPHLPLKDLGFDSLMAVELANQLTSATGITLPMTLMFDYPTIHAISGYIVRNVLLLDTGEHSEHN